jgi:hypothetical protein
VVLCEVLPQSHLVSSAVACSVGVTQSHVQARTGEERLGRRNRKSIGGGRGSLGIFGLQAIGGGRVLATFSSLWVPRVHGQFRLSCVARRGQLGTPIREHPKQNVGVHCGKQQLNPAVPATAAAPKGHDGGDGARGRFVVQV